MFKNEFKRFEWPVIGHANIIGYLKNCLANQKVSQAYLFVGPTQVGKTLVAQNFVNSLVCQNLRHQSGKVPCGECEGCRQLANQIHPDVIWLGREANEKTGKLKKNISIEQMRELQNRLSLHSFLNSYKIAVISEAETLSQEAANSLLKTLEEPAPKTVIILLANQLMLLPKTIVSRCQVLKFLPVATKEIFDYLLVLKVERKKAKVLAALAEGRPGVALGYLQDPDSYAVFQEQTKQFISLIKADIINRFKIIGEIVSWDSNDSIKQTLAVWKKVLRDLILIKYLAPNLVSNLNLMAELTALGGSYSSSDLIKMIIELDLAKRYLDANANPRLTLENLVLIF